MHARSFSRIVLLSVLTAWGLPLLTAPGVEKEGIPVGPLSLRPFVGVSETYDSNILVTRPAFAPGDPSAGAAPAPAPPGAPCSVRAWWHSPWPCVP